MNDHVPVTAESMKAAADAELAVLRAKGVPIPKSEAVDALFRVAFVGGVEWAYNVIARPAE